MKETLVALAGNDRLVRAAHTAMFAAGALMLAVSLGAVLGRAIGA